MDFKFFIGVVQPLLPAQLIFVLLKWFKSDWEEDVVDERIGDEPILSSVLVTDSSGVEWIPNEKETENSVFKQLDELFNRITAKKNVWSWIP